jgi:hypothetical protein
MYSQQGLLKYVLLCFICSYLSVVLSLSLYLPSTFFFFHSSPLNFPCSHPPILNGIASSDTPPPPEDRDGGGGEGVELFKPWRLTSGPIRRESFQCPRINYPRCPHSHPRCTIILPYSLRLSPPPHTSWRTQRRLFQTTLMTTLTTQVGAF